MNELTQHQTSDPMALCASIARSGIAGAKTPEAAFALACMALADDPAGGDSPVAFMRALGRATAQYHIVNGRPTMKAETMLARFQQAGGKVRWGEYSDKRCEGTFSHPQGGEITLDWTMERAKAAGLIKPGPWMGHSRAMLRSRVISEAIRTVFPGILSGSYTPDEADEIPSDAPAPGPVIVAVPGVDLKARANALYIKVVAKDAAAAKAMLSAAGNRSADFIAKAEAWLADQEPVVITGADEPPTTLANGQEQQP